jgi:putative chitinase
MPTASTLLSVDNLIEAGVAVSASKAHAQFLAEAATRFDINTAQRAAAFLGQCMHETAGLTEFEENLRYTSPERVAAIFRTAFDMDRDRVVDPEEIEFAKSYVRNPQALANRVYANRFGNGDEASGDGWRYRGRGGGHLTFKANYQDAGVALSRPYVDQPELVAQPRDAALTFAWFWATRGCNAAADRWDLRAVTRAINPGMAAHDHRVQLCTAALRAMQ